MKKLRFVLILCVMLGLSVFLASCGGGDSAKFTVTFDSQGGSAISSYKNVASGNKIVSPTTEPSLDEYGFGGWFKESTCNNAWNFETDKVTSNVTLYAKWLDIASFKLSLINSDTQYAIGVADGVTLKGAITLPSSYKGKAVTAIAESGFKAGLRIMK